MKKWDWYIIGGLCLLAVISFVLLRAPWAGTGSEAVVTIDGVVYARLSLALDETLALPETAGGSVLVVQNGEISVQSAACPDQICVAHKPVSRQGETIVCLPYRVLVEIVGDDAATPDSGAPDIVAGGG